MFLPPLDIVIALDVDHSTLEHFQKAHEKLANEKLRRDLIVFVQKQILSFKFIFHEL